MNFLPIADRELRVAARKRGTFWVRVAAAATAVVIGSAFFLLSQMRGAGAIGMGSELFAVLSWLCLAAGLSAGLFFTSDCLSEEKREGTLGLLFLTDLRGYDVALGKLLATSLRGFYALLAVLPILAITQLMGGITGEQYWKSSLGLVNALFVSLAAGMAVSALSRDSQKALSATVFVLLLLALGGPLADMIIAGVKKRSFQTLWSLSSPGYVLAAASAWGRSSYWAALAVTQLIGWAMLGLACALVPHTWQDKKRAGTIITASWAYAWRYGGARRRRRLRRKLLDLQPVAWLACRERWQSLGVWAMAILVVGGFVAVLIKMDAQEGWIFWNYLGGLFTLLLYLWTASQACRFFVEARRTGLLELLLATPVSGKQIVRGQLMALLRMFGLPVVMLLGVHIAGSALSQLGFQQVASQVSTVTSSMATNQSGTFTNQAFSVNVTVAAPAKGRTNAAPTPGGFQLRPVPHRVVMAVTAAAAAGLGTVANLFALCWFGMWMGMTSRTANLATLKTILFVQVIPWFVIAFGSSMFVMLLMSGLAFRGGAAQSSAYITWWPLLSTLLAAGIAVAKDVGFIVWSRNKLHSSLREQAAGAVGQARFAVPPPLPAAALAPPIISAPR
jgi:ABC-type transport system involved in multi-copper enzyme maturation permease subunit